MLRPEEADVNTRAAALAALSPLGPLEAGPSPRLSTMHESLSVADSAPGVWRVFERVCRRHGHDPATIAEAPPVARTPTEAAILLALRGTRDDVIGALAVAVEFLDPDRPSRTSMLPLRPVSTPVDRAVPATVLNFAPVGRRKDRP